MWYKFAQFDSLALKLKSLKSTFVAKAQEIYDDWDEDLEVYAGGGICHLIADGFVEILNQNFPDKTSFTISDPNEVHVYAAIIDANMEEIDDENDEVYDIYYIDIHHSTYETGAGYNWKKIPNVIFGTDDLSIYKSTEDIENLKMLMDGY